jgi:hypothetical protein
MESVVLGRAAPVGLLLLLLLSTAIAGAGAGPAAASSGHGSDPPFDFTDDFYRANGVDPARLAGRPTGSDGRSVVDESPDPTRRDVRLLSTLPAYDHSGGMIFFNVFADLQPNAFTANRAGRDARQLAEASLVYVFPRLGGDPLGLGNNRQADLIDLRHGYFSNNPLGIWVHVFVNWAARAFNTADGRRALAELADDNGLALDGTPIITTLSELEDLTDDGFVTQQRRATTAVGRWFICPVIEDPRDGAIAPDARLNIVRRPDGTPLPAEQRFLDNFESLRTTGDWAD